MIRFPCPHCAAMLKADDAAAGSAAKCRDCGTRITVPTLAAMPPIDPSEVLFAETPRSLGNTFVSATPDEALESRAVKSTWRPDLEKPKPSATNRPLVSQAVNLWLKARRLLFPGCWLVTGILVALFCWWSPPSLWRLVGVAGVMIASVDVVSLLHRRVPMRWWLRGLLRIILFVVAVIWYVQHGTHDEFNTDENILSVRSYRWGSSRPYYARIYSQRGLSSLEGGYSESGKKHGEWKLFDHDGARSDWYWYGEEITEGEWHLRNNGRR